MTTLIDQLFEIVVGDMKISPNCFYQMSIRESSLAVNGHFKAVERDYNLAFMASYNANGAIQGGKKFKIEHPFDKKKQQAAKKPTKEERDSTLEWLKTKF